MIRELSALLKRYYVTYFRVSKKPLSDLILGFVLAGALTLNHLGIFGALTVIVYLLTLPFTNLISVRTTLGELVSEKASGIKEYLKLNGLSHYTYQLYAFIVTTQKTIFFTTFTILGILLGNYIGDFTHSKSIFVLKISTAETIAAVLICSLATISFTLFLTTLFNDSKVATSMGSVIYMGISLVSLLVFKTDQAVYYYLVCLFPQSALALSLFMDPDQAPPEVTRERVNWFMVFDFVMFSVLYVYLDQVLKDENGTKRSYFFCLNCLKRKSRFPQQAKNKPLNVPLLNHSSHSHEEEKSSSSPVYDIDYSSAIYHEVLTGAQLMPKAVQVNSLKKHFKHFAAVDNISFSIFSGQIFCLLGHNGAGKTTTIRMLTGLLEIDGGEILYDGEDLFEKFKEVRTKIGICAQQDILFEKLKVHEHLELIAKLRKIPTQEIPRAVDEALHKVNLVNERDRFAENLSGGNKRKLSLAMAVLGKTKVIFLDEPTSGMDPQNRRVMWHHLKQLREQGMTILLTTHHLDEADELADRIAIMSKGKLLAMGTSEFFKKNFGVGYHLNLMPIYEKINSEEFIGMKEKLQGLISGVIPSAKFDEQTANDVLKCSLPFTAQKMFPDLFKELENIDTIRMSVEMNTLEDVFVNIGLSEDSLLQGEAAHNQININVVPPQCISEKPVYSFWAQTLALGKRRIYLLTRSGRNIFLLTLPLVMTLFGIIGALGFQDVLVSFGFFQGIIILAYALSIAPYCALPVYEREEKMKYLMDVMGLRRIPYWISNFVIDFIAFSVINLCMGALYYWFYSRIKHSVDDYLYFAKPDFFFKVSIPHGAALISLGYCYSFLFDKALSAIKYFPLIYFFILFSIGGFFVYEIHGDVPLSDNPHWEPIVAAMSPSTVFMQYLLNSKGGLETYECVLYEIGYAVFYFIVTVVIDHMDFESKAKKPKKEWTVSEPQAVPVETLDVEREKRRTLENAKDPIRALDLVKVYDNGYKAVRNVTFGVPNGQIFGLLGPNGAGKSTTFNILTAALSKTGGSVQLLGKEVNKHIPEVYENVGICPQFNGLYDFLTVKEHLLLFGNLKGLRGKKLDSIIEYYLDVLQLRRFANKMAQELSGGNKRKLSVGIAFIGSANLIFLDEPSTGVDPLARRYLWNSIQQVLNLRGASVVLTTHSMYEAESLSHKIGILINGRFVCIGPTQYLKEKYSQGYKITVAKVSIGDNPMDRVLEMFPKAERIKEASYIQQTYHVPFEGFKFSEAFEKLELLKQEGVIKDFSIYNTTLEQIFVYFSKFQINADNEEHLQHQEEIMKEKGRIGEEEEEEKQEIRAVVE